MYEELDAYRPNMVGQLCASGITREDAEDIFQDAIIRVFQYAELHQVSVGRGILWQNVSWAARDFFKSATYKRGQLALELDNDIDRDRHDLISAGVFYAGAQLGHASAPRPVEGDVIVRQLYDQEAQWLDGEVLTDLRIHFGS